MHPSVIVARDETSELLKQLKAMDQTLTPSAGLSNKSGGRNPLYFAWEKEEDIEEDQVNDNEVEESEGIEATEEEGKDLESIINDSVSPTKEDGQELEKESIVAEESLTTSTGRKETGKEDEGKNENKNETVEQQQEETKGKEGKQKKALKKKKNKNKKGTASRKYGTFAPWGTWINPESVERVPFIPPGSTPVTDMNDLAVETGKGVTTKRASVPWALDIEVKKSKQDEVLFNLEEDIELQEDDFVLVGSPKAIEDADNTSTYRSLPPWGTWEKDEMISKGGEKPTSKKTEENEEEETWSLDEEEKIMSEYQKQFQWHGEKCASDKAARDRIAQKNSARGITYTLTGGVRPEPPMSPKVKKLKKESLKKEGDKLLKRMKTNNEIYAVLHPPTATDLSFNPTMLHKSDNIWPLIEDSQKPKEVVNSEKPKVENEEINTETQKIISTDPAIDDIELGPINRNKIDQVGVLLNMLSVNHNLPSKKKNKVVKTTSKTIKTNGRLTSATTSKKKVAPTTSTKRSSNTKKKNEKKEKAASSRTTVNTTQTNKMNPMNPITHSFVWPPPLPTNAKTEYDDVYKWPCYLSSPKSAVVTGL